MNDMTKSDDKLFCTVICWLIGLLVAVVAGYMLMVFGELGLAATIFIGLIIFAGVGFLLSSTICSINVTERAAAPQTTAVDASTPAPPLPAPKADPPSAPSPHRTTIPASAITPSATLPGEVELASRKGTWKYEKPAADKGEDYDGDGVVEGTNEGTKPATLSAAREGGPDDLKQIKGVGPKMEGMLHDMGFYHFDQVANWTADEVAWVDANLEGFKGRVSRDDWVAQAKVLAAGGETEFSKKVEDGGVYD